MSHTSHALLAVTDQLRVSGLVLAALESGRLAMDAADYRDMAVSAAQELSSLDTAELQLASFRLPPALLDIADNLLFERACRYRWGPRRNPVPRAWPDVLELLSRPI